MCPARRVRICDAAPIEVCFEGQQTTTHPGQILETPIRPANPNTSTPVQPDQPGNEREPALRAVSDLATFRNAALLPAIQYLTPGGAHSVIVRGGGGAAARRTA
ncbi:MAG TPA: hypothetical protein VI094_17235 [Propionibacteriaceae bacterium]